MFPVCLKRLVAAAVLVAAPLCQAQRPAVSAAPLKVAVITLEEAVLATREGQAAAAPLQAKYALLQRQLSEQQARVDRLQQKLRELPAGTPDTERAAMEQELDRQNRLMGAGAHAATAQYQSDLKHALATLEPKVRAVAVTMARRRGYQALIDGSDPNVVLWCSPVANLSDEVVKAYDQGAATAAPLPLMIGGGGTVNPVAILQFGQDVVSSGEGQKVLGEVEKRHVSDEQRLKGLQGEVAAAQRSGAAATVTAKQQELAQANEEVNRRYHQEMQEGLQRVANSMFAGMTQYAEGQGYLVLVNGAITQPMVVWAADGVDAAALNARAARIDAAVLQALKAK